MPFHALVYDFIDKVGLWLFYCKLLIYIFSLRYGHKVPSLDILD